VWVEYVSGCVSVLQGKEVWRREEFCVDRCLVVCVCCSGVCCSGVLQWCVVVVCGWVREEVIGCVFVLQWSVCCNVCGSVCVAVRGAVSRSEEWLDMCLQHTTTHCNMLQHVATHCNMVGLVSTTH